MAAYAISSLLPLGNHHKFINLDMSQFELLVCSFFYQFTLYAALRLAHRGFTIGELGLVCFGGTALFMELLNITMARVSLLIVPFHLLLTKLTIT